MTQLPTIEWCNALMSILESKRDQLVWTSLIMAAFLQALVIMLLESIMYIGVCVCTAQISMILLKWYQNQDSSTPIRVFIGFMVMEMSIVVWSLLYGIMTVGKMGRKWIVDNMQRYIVNSDAVERVARGVVWEIQQRFGEVIEMEKVRKSVAKVAVGMLFDRMSVIQGERFLRDMVRYGGNGGVEVYHEQIRVSQRMDMGG